MPQSRRALAATADLTTTPPDNLSETHRIARVTKAAGNHLYYIEYPGSTTAESPIPSANLNTGNDRDNDGAHGLANQPAVTNANASEGGCANTALTELHPRFRNTIYLKRGSFVVVDVAALAERSNKLGGEIVNVVREERAWRKMRWWPREFGKIGGYGEIEGRGMLGDVIDEGEESGSDGIEGEGEVDGEGG